MRFRRRSFGRRPRQPVYWNHIPPRKFTGSGANVGVATLLSGSIFGDTGIDEQITLLRLHLHILASKTTALQLQNYLYCGVFLGLPGAPTPVPNMPATADQQADWLGFKTISFIEQTVVASTSNLRGVDVNDPHWDIKAKRKLSPQMVISVSAVLDNLTAAPTGTESWAMAVAGHALFQRTMRR